MSSKDNQERLFMSLYRSEPEENSSDNGINISVAIEAEFGRKYAGVQLILVQLGDSESVEAAPDPVSKSRALFGVSS